MSLRGEVGRHVGSGRQCQNWKLDQQIVIGLLNLIPIASGGAAGGLQGRVVGGLASRALCNAIAAFEKMHFGQVSGHVSPNGPMWRLLNKLASIEPPKPPTPLPPIAGMNVPAPSVRRSLRAGLYDDGIISFADVVNIMRATLADGRMSWSELDSLYDIRLYATQLDPDGADLLDWFLKMLAKRNMAGKTIYQLQFGDQRRAVEMVFHFLLRRGGQQFPKLSRNAVGVGLLERVAYPDSLDQGKAGLCGPAVALHVLVNDDPVGFVTLAARLFEKGRAPYRNLIVAPGADVRNYRPPADYAQVDWLTMASLRDSENFLFDFDSIDDSDGGTSSEEMADWFRRAGYRDVREDVIRDQSRNIQTVNEANRLYSQGYWVCLFINDNMLYQQKQHNSSKGLNHVVVQRSLIEHASGIVQVKIFTWGDGEFQVPPNVPVAPPLAQPRVPPLPALPLLVKDFLKNFYGFVAAKA